MPTGVNTGEFSRQCVRPARRLSEVVASLLPRAPGDEDSGAIQVHHTIKRIILDEGALIEPPILELKAEDIQSDD